MKLCHITITPWQARILIFNVNQDKLSCSLPFHRWHPAETKDLPAYVQLYIPAISWSAFNGDSPALLIPLTVSPCSFGCHIPLGVCLSSPPSLELSVEFPHHPLPPSSPAALSAAPLHQDLLMVKKKSKLPHREMETNEFSVVTSPGIWSLRTKDLPYGIILMVHLDCSLSVSEKGARKSAVANYETTYHRESFFLTPLS